MNKRIEELITRYKELAPLSEDIGKAYEILAECYHADGKLLVAGNGGSASDSEHIVGELMKGFVKKRTLPDEMKKNLKKVSEDKGEILGSSLQGALPAIALDSHIALNSAFLNDVADGGLLYYAQSVMAYGRKNDVFLGISTSGNAKNVIYAAIAAKARGMKVIALTGKSGGELKDYADCSVIIPCNETFKIQELHLPVYHCLCLMLEDEFFND